MPFLMGRGKHGKSSNLNSQFRTIVKCDVEMNFHKVFVDWRGCKDKFVFSPRNRLRMSSMLLD